MHTLAVKRASRLVEVDKDFHYKQGETVKEMLAVAQQKLKAAGFRPYYLYRQKHMAGAFENTGYCKGDTPCIYNIRIMEEKQTILALGARRHQQDLLPGRKPSGTGAECFQL